MGTLPAETDGLASAAAAQRRLVAALAEALGRAQGGPATLIETHISYVVVAGDAALKVKKALRLPFADYSTLARRRFCCDEELRLNRRLAPGLYRDVVAVTGSARAPVLGGDGAPLEYAVRMRAFPQDAIATALLARGALAPAHVDELAATVAAFHAGLPPAPRDSPHGTPAQVLADALANFAEIGPLAPPPLRPRLRELRRWTDAAFHACAPSLARRREDGRVRECHGDLHLGNVALVDGRVTVFDGIEFNAGLRWIDVASEAAFTTMDLADRGRSDLAWRFCDAWLQATGDYDSVSVLRFFLVYRALVRAKVTCLRAAQVAAPAGHAALEAEATRYVDLAWQLASQRTAALVVTHGPAGAGKTTLAQAIVEALPAIRLRSDVERKRLAGLAPLAASGSALDEGLYGAAATARTYARLAEHAGRIVDAGYVALLDATFLHRWQRDAMRALAQRRRVPFVVLDFRLPEATLRARGAARAATAGDASEATVAVLDAQLARREPLADVELADAIAVTPGRDAAGIVATLRERVAAGAA